LEVFLLPRLCVWGGKPQHHHGGTVKTHSGIALPVGFGLSQNGLAVMLLTVLMSAKLGIRVAALALALWLTAGLPAQALLRSGLFTNYTNNTFTAPAFWEPPSSTREARLEFSETFHYVLYRVKNRHI